MAGTAPAPAPQDLLLVPADCEDCECAKGFKPVPVKWSPKKGSLVKIINISGVERELFNITEGLFVPDVRSIRIEAGGVWYGLIGNVNTGGYQYDDGCPPPKGRLRTLAVRQGTIDPS
jgi:hypothetical protein